ncbi:MAG: sulfatase family protein [Opitutales bacterium]
MLKPLSYLLIGLAAAVMPAKERPNIILYLSDDLGYGDLGFMGHPYAKTPNLDKLAAEGTVFMQHYVAGVTCAPSRTGIMTGVAPSRFLHYPADFGYGDQPTITDILSDHGYATGHFGKWHMGVVEGEGVYSYDEAFLESNNKNDFNTASRDEPLTDKAIDFIERMAAEGKPFYANVWGHSTHFPVKHYPEFVDEVGDFEFKREDFDNPTIQDMFDKSLTLKEDLKDSLTQYMADVYGMDKNLGRIVETVKRLGIAENTIIVYSSDHGPAEVKVSGNKGGREFEEHMLGYAGPLRGGKGNQLDGGVRVPFVLWWPGKVEAGRVDTQSVTSFLDWLPTLASITGAPGVPEQLDGQDISDVWFEGPRDRGSDLFWKVNSRTAPISIRDGKWKFHEVRGGTPELYDLSRDSREINNVIADFPEVAAQFKKRLAELKSVLPSDYIKAEKNDARAMARAGAYNVDFSAPAF